MTQLFQNFDSLSASERQFIASSPSNHVWVGASAGTGKTKVLTDRVLRLLLPNEKGQSADPASILCITFTKAAAAEMQTRLQDRLAGWLSKNDADLSRELFELTGRSVDETVLLAARRLFARVVDIPGGMKIKTIHGFCESVLKRFPIEAGLSPDFSIILDSEANLIIRDVATTVLQSDQLKDNTAFLKTQHYFTRQLKANAFDELITMLVNERSAFTAFFHSAQTLASALRFITDMFGFKDGQIPEKDDVIRDAVLRYSESDMHAVISMLLSSKSKTDIDKGNYLNQAVAHIKSGHLNDAFDCINKAVSNKKLATNDIIDQYEGSVALKVMGELHSLMAETLDTIKSIQSAEASCHLTLLAYMVISHYQDTKRQRGLLDFNDLIITTVELLTRADQAAWVLYKLDSRIDHILLDEAQDTSPDQWNVIKALTDEFFSGLGRDDRADRSVFVVGDEKQSIYSFQKADPQKFKEMHAHFVKKISDAGQQLIYMPMNQSFRSGVSVLKMVDHVYAFDAHRAGVTLVGNENIEHRVFHENRLGCVELWPYAVLPEKRKHDAWQPPLTVRSSETSERRLARVLAQEIASRLKEGVVMPSTGRPLQPKDILIIVQKRGDVMGAIVRALKNNNIPVAGVDRLKITEEISIMDMIALAEFCLLPDDDLSLACVLKSPLIGYNDDDLMRIGLGRENRSLWWAVQQDLQSAPVVAYLKDNIQRSARERVYEFFAGILNAPCPGHAISGLKAMVSRLGYDSIDPLYEFLSQVFEFERNNHPLLQLFLAYFQRLDTDIKREAENAELNQVRIMTVHGSKGLEAPLVIIADACSEKSNRSASLSDKLFWAPYNQDNDRSVKAPLWSIKAEQQNSFITVMKEMAKERQADEYRRLLYVALTRAKDCLIITGSQPKKTKEDEPVKSSSWYGMIETTFTHLGPDVVDVPCSFDTTEGWSRSTIQLFGKRPTALKEQALATFSTESIPADMMNHEWAFTHPAEEPKPYKPFTPSRPTSPEPALLSPLVAGEEGRIATIRYKRGQVLHKLFQYLPDIQPEQREGRALDYLRRHLPDYDDHQCKALWGEVSDVLNHPEFAAIFGPQSRAEVPVTGLLKKLQSDDGGYILSGQIDRLVILPDQILIVDFKTNRPSPVDIKDVPQAYKNQLAAYRAALSDIYPDRSIKTALLWTDRLNLMIIDL